MAGSAYKRKKCQRGKSCASTCISRSRICRVELSSSNGTQLSKFRDYLKHNGLHLAEHVGKGMIAWKTGKVLAPAVTGFLESQYGIPREASEKLTEAVIQAATATALESKQLKNVSQLTRKIVSETAAALLGKAAHSGAESALSTQEAKEIIKQVAPVLAGKVTGITAAMAVNKIPPPRDIAQAVIERSIKDTNKILNLFGQRQLAFAEENSEAELLADLALAALMLATE